METIRHPEFNDTEQSPDYRQKLITLFDEYHLAVPVETINICAAQLTALQVKYHDYAYHNDQHSFDGICRGVKILHSVSKFVNVTPRDYELLIVAGAYHDDTLKDAPDSNMTAEQASAHQAIMATGMDSTEGKRLVELIMVTEVTYDTQGVHQINLFDEGVDILKFALGFADIGAIVMEGRERMIQDVVNLALERYKTDSKRLGTTLNSLIPLIGMQRQFVDERLRNLDDGINHYFSQYGDTVVRQITDELHSQFTAPMLEIQSLLGQFESQLPAIRHRLQIKMRMNELKGKGNCSQAIQQKLKEVLDEL